MNMDGLYTIYETLSKAGDEIAQHSKDYKDVIKSEYADVKEKKLATQIITNFFSAFPAFQNEALDAIFTFCEDDDKTIRIAAMKSLPKFCKDVQFISTIAGVMAQMLQLDDPAEHTITCNIFMDVLRKDPKTVIIQIFKNIQDEKLSQLCRLKCIQFVVNKIRLLDSTLLTAEVQDLMIENVKNALHSCAAEEFILLMGYLVTTSYVKTFVGQKDVFDIVLGQIDINNDFVPLMGSNNNVNRLITCAKFVIPFFSAKVESTELVQYYCKKVLPAWSEIGAITNGMQYHAVIAQQLAAMAVFCGPLERPIEEVGKIFEILLLYMPEPPEDTTSDAMPEFNFTLVEALLSAFHSLARQCPVFLVGDSNLLKDFRARLLYLSRAVQGCLKVQNLATTDKVFNADEKRIREMCPLVWNNINTLIKDLFYQPPNYKCKIVLSFNAKDDKAMPEIKKPAFREPEKPVNKRHAPITFDNSSNGAAPQSKNKRGGSVYVPPSGKFSHNIQRGRGGKFRGGRSRGRGFRH